MREQKQKNKFSRYEVLSTGWVMTDYVRCVQCGVCSYNCPMGIDVRQHSWLGVPVSDCHCLTCGECIKRCPRGALYFERLPFTKDEIQ